MPVGYHAVSTEDSMRKGADMEFEHRSVLLKETVDGLKVKPDGVYVRSEERRVGKECRL